MTPERIGSRTEVHHDLGDGRGGGDPFDDSHT